MIEVPIRIVDDLFSGSQEDRQPGCAKWYVHADSTWPGKEWGLNFICPCGCGSLLGIVVAGPKAWQWNGDRINPTITPSIRHMAGCEWHGYLTDGVFKSC